LPTGHIHIFKLSIGCKEALHTIPFIKGRNASRMSDSLKQTKILKEYEKQGDEIVQQMTRVLMKAQKKADNLTYRKLLEEFEGIKESTD